MSEESVEDLKRELDLLKLELETAIEDPTATMECDINQDANAPHGVNTEEEMSHTNVDPITD